MHQPTLTIFYQYDPWDSTIGGIQTTVSSFLKYCPAAFKLRFVGITTSTSLEIGQWHEMQLEGRPVLFMPVLYVEDDNHRKLFLPTTLLYTIALLKYDVSSDFMHFHRLEPALAALRSGGDKTFFVHNDIHRQIMSRDTGQKSTMLWRYAPRLYGALERFLLRQFTLVLSCNSDSVALYRERYPEVAERVELIRNTVDDELFYPLSPIARDHERCSKALELGLAEDTKFVLFAGRLHPQKDPLLLIRAFSLLQLPNVHLLVAGEGELRSEVEAEILRLELAEKVTLLGPLKQIQLAALHKLSSACILTSRFEGFPLVVLESLASGTPVVSTSCGETPKILSPKSGMICNQASPEDIAAALRRVLSSPEQFLCTSCVQDAQPYKANNVINEVYELMLQRWTDQQVVMDSATC